MRTYEYIHAVVADTVTTCDNTIVHEGIDVVATFGTEQESRANKSFEEVGDLWSSPYLPGSDVFISCRSFFPKGTETEQGPDTWIL